MSDELAKEWLQYKLAQYARLRCRLDNEKI